MSDEHTSMELAPADPLRRPGRLALYLGIALIIAGGIVLYIGYDGTATHPLTQAQIPYVVSGGLLGLGLMLLGGIGLVIAVVLQAQAAFRADVTAMREGMESLAEALSHQIFTPLAGTSTNGHSTVYVARGASSFHRVDCRLVARAEHTKALPRDEAEGTGLVPCRICKP